MKKHVLKFILAGAGILTGVALIAGQKMQEPRSTDTGRGSSTTPFLGSQTFPDPKLTPGVLNLNVTQENLKTTVCVHGWSSKQRPPVSWTAPRKRESIKQYGYQDTNPSHYEYDHLVPISLGGVPKDTRNLWPQRLSGEYNAKDKDRVEFYLYKQVCAGKMGLKEAQEAIRTDWLEVYDGIAHQLGSAEEAIDPDDIE